MCVCVCVLLTGRFQHAVTNADVHRSAHQDGVIARCKEEEEEEEEKKRRSARTVHGRPAVLRDRGERWLTVLAAVRRRREDVEVVVQTPLVDAGLVGLGFLLPGQASASRHHGEKTTPVRALNVRKCGNPTQH